MRAWSGFGLVLLFGSAVGCFSDSPSPPQSCRTGEAGCDCDAGSCGSGLQCEDAIDKCIPIGCDPGTENCTCSGGTACFDPLTCQDHVCKPPGSSGSSGVATTMTQADDTGSSSTAGVTSTPDDVGNGTTTSPMTSADGSTGETGGNPCLACMQTYFDVVDDACKDPATMCADTPGCGELSTCILQGLDVVMCCADMPPPRDAWNAFADCAAQQPACEMAGCQQGDFICS